MALLEAQEIHDAAFGSENNATRGTIKALVDLCEGWDKLDTAAKWRARLPEASEQMP